MKSDGPGESRRKPKGDKRARTRTALIEAASALTREKGYENTTLEDVARRAGMTTGAIYGNFKNRDELFIAIAQTAWTPIKPLIRPGSSFAEMLQALAAATVAAIPERRAAAIHYLSGGAYALNHPEIQARGQAITAESYAAGASWIRSVAKPEELSMPPEVLVTVIHALTNGLLLQRFMTPELVPDEAFYAAFAALARPTT